MPYSWLPQPEQANKLERFWPDQLSALMTEGSITPAIGKLLIIEKLCGTYIAGTHYAGKFRNLR